MLLLLCVSITHALTDINPLRVPFGQCQAEANSAGLVSCEIVSIAVAAGTHHPQHPTPNTHHTHTLSTLNAMSTTCAGCAKISQKAKIWAGRDRPLALLAFRGIPKAQGLWHFNVKLRLKTVCPMFMENLINFGLNSTNSQLTTRVIGRPC